jgi:PhoH-like ATPase
MVYNKQESVIMAKKEATFTGVSVINVDESFIKDLENRKGLSLEERQKFSDEDLIKEHALYPNMGLVLKTADKTLPSVLARTSRDNKQIWLLNENIGLLGEFKPRNKEQVILTNLLSDPKVRLHIIVGKAGSGKTFVTAAHALKSIDPRTDNNYSPKFDQVILTKSMKTVGDINLGAVPGNIEEKFYPYLINFRTTFQSLVGHRGLSLIEMLESRRQIVYIPIQLMRGASFNNTLLIVDEAQNLTCHEVKTVGTRLGENSSVIFMGDLTQIDVKLPAYKTGLYHLMNSDIIKNSHMSASIGLIKNERSELSNLIDDAFTDIEK